MVTSKKGASSKAKAAKMEQQNLSSQERDQMIRKAAYYLAEQRGFERGNELSDWLEAELQIDAELSC